MCRLHCSGGDRARPANLELNRAVDVVPLWRMLKSRGPYSLKFRQQIIESDARATPQSRWLSNVSCTARQSATGWPKPIVTLGSEQMAS
jgi:hypothetical protein